MAALIALHDVTYRYPGATAPALRGITLELAPGEIVGVAGPNGSGKSTLSVVVAGLAPRVLGGSLTGRVTLDGADAAVLAMHEVVERVGIGFHSPATQLSGVSGSVYEEVAFGPANLGRPVTEVVEATESALETLGIGYLAARDPDHLSGGEQQLTALAGLLAMRPDVIVLDEPTSQLDPRAARLVRDAIERLATSGVAILLAEHRTDLLLDVCARVVLLARGEIAFEGVPRDALNGDRTGTLGIAEPSALRIERLTTGAA